MTFEAVTRDVRVSVQSYYLREHSDPDEGQHVWAYRIRLTNEGVETVQLLNRHWIITDAAGVTKEVKGAGVIGEQPVLDPGQKFVYTSGTPLGTSSGFMRGTYEFTTDAGETFLVEIPAFSLDSPHHGLQIN